MAIGNNGLGSNTKLCRAGTIVNCMHIRENGVSGNGFIPARNIACRIRQQACLAKQGGMSTFAELGSVFERLLDGVEVVPSKLGLESKIVYWVGFGVSCFNSRVDEIWWIREFNG